MTQILMFAYAFVLIQGTTYCLPHRPHLMHHVLLYNYSKIVYKEYTFKDAQTQDSHFDYLYKLTGVFFFKVVIIIINHMINHDNNVSDDNVKT